LATVHDDPNTPNTAFVSAAFVVVLVAAVVALQAHYENKVKEFSLEKTTDRSPRELLENRAAQQAMIDRYEWVDREAGVVAIPVDRAMDLVASELAGGDGVVTNP